MVYFMIVIQITLYGGRKALAVWLLWLATNAYENYM